MRRLALLAISLCGALLAACGGGNSNPAPPPPSGNFSNASLSGHYAFAMSGADGVTDVNDGAFTPSGPLAIPASTYQLDASGNGTNFGRGTLTLNGKAYAFYIVDSTQINVLEEGQSGGSEGPAFLQTGAIPAKNSDFNGSFIFLTGGSVTTGTFGPIARLGRMTADGNGNIASVAFDENDDGHNTHVAESASISNANYAIDVVNAGSGRGTFTFKNSSVGTPSYVFYMY